MKAQLFILLALVFMFSCGGNAYLDSNGEPTWVSRGSGAFNEDGKRVFYGVGMVSGIRNRALARSTGENRSRAELQKIFSTYSASLMRDYMASTAGMGDMSSEEQHVEQTIKTFSKGTLSGVQIVDHFWSEDGTHFALAKLDLTTFGDSLEKAKELNSRTRDFIRANAQKAFDKLDAEEAKDH